MTFIKGFNHVSFTVSDMGRSLAFYRDLLGMTLEADREIQGPHISQITGFSGARLRAANLRLGGLMVELIQYREPVGEQPSLRTCNVGNAHVGFDVEDLPRLVQELSAKGVSFRSEPVAIPSGPLKGGYVVYLSDPDGITLEFIQRPLAE
jgi:lactoylglutathione lyase